MGKFDGVLLISDYDDTLYNSKLTVSEENHRAIRRFMENGGRFTIATGRAHRTFTPQIQRERLEFNAPVILSNGADIYDYAAGRYLIRTGLSEEVRGRLIRLCHRFPSLGLEAYHGEEIYVYNPNLVTQTHLERIGVPYTLCPIEDMPAPWSKLLLEQDHPILLEVQAYIRAHWQDCCEAIFSNRYLLEITAKGSNKGTMAAKVAELLGIGRKDLYCIGDNMNDLPMLALSAIPFAPDNCAQAVRDWGARILPHCDEHAVARAIEILDTIY